VEIFGGALWGCPATGSPGPILTWLQRHAAAPRPPAHTLGTQGESLRLYDKATTAEYRPNKRGIYGARAMPLVAAAVLPNVDWATRPTEDTAQGGMEPLRPSPRGL